MNRQIARGKIEMFNRHEMLDVVVVDGKARGIIARNLVTGEIERHSAHAVLICSGGYGNVFFLSTNAMGSNVTAGWKIHKKGAHFANPCFTQIHPTCIPVSGEYQSKLTLMSESLRNDGRVWVPKKVGDDRAPQDIPEDERDYYLERRYPSFGNLVPRDVASRNAKAVCDEGRGVGTTGLAVYLDFRDAITRMGRDTVAAKYGNLFDMYERITGENPYETPMKIFPAVHYTMGGLWVDYNLMSNLPGLFVLGEANFSDHGANRLGASALMQGLADGYFVIPYTLGHYIASDFEADDVDTNHIAFNEAEAQARAFNQRLIDIQGTRSPTDFHRDLGHIMWEKVGMGRTADGLKEAISSIQALRAEFWQDLRIPGDANTFNKNLEHAGRVADFMELGELMARDALERDESCGGHFREEHQTEDGEAVRNDEKFSHVAAWEYTGTNSDPIRHIEDLKFDNVKLTTRSYK